MKNTRQHILVVLAAVMIFFSSCSRDGAKVIPRNTLAEIYAEMLVTDQWVTTNTGIRRVADTSLVYEPILNKYGYDSEDYRKSIDKYMNDPERFSRILRTTGEILDARITELKLEKERRDELAKVKKIKSDFEVTDYVPYWDDEYYVHYHDSLEIVLDSAKRMYTLKSVETADTLYEGIRRVKPAPEVEKKDTAAADTLKRVLLPNARPLRIRPDSMTAIRPALNTGERRIMDLDTLRHF